MDEFLQHKNQSCPPSLSEDGKLRLPQKKSEQAECFQSCRTSQLKMPEEIDAIVIDGSVVVNMIKPTTEKTFAEYSRQSVLPYTFNRSSLMQSALMSYGMNILQAVQMPLLEVNEGREAGGAHSRPEKYHATRSSSYGVKKTSKNFSRGLLWELKSP